MCTSTVGNREINLQRGMVTATKMYLKREVPLALLRLFHLVQCIKFAVFFWSWILSDVRPEVTYCVEEKEKESCCLVFTSPTKCEIRHFHVVVVQWQQSNVQKKHDAPADLLFCQYKPISFVVLADLAVVVA